jgi:hypothetical protein
MQHLHRIAGGWVDDGRSRSHRRRRDQRHLRHASGEVADAGNNNEDAEMKKWTKFAIPIAVVTAFVAWYAFRPERLVVNRRVDEAMPNIQGGSSSQPLVAG